MNIADLRYALGPARDQGRRPTCLAFSLSDAHRVARSHGEDFSAECLHQLAAAFGGYSLDSAVSALSALTVLATPGQVEEPDWPYGVSQLPDPSSNFYTASHVSYQFDAAAIVSDLANGCPVVVAAELGEEFHLASGSHELDAPSRRSQTFHAVLLVAARRTGSDIAFLVRNSWGAGWADDGHVWARAPYLEQVTKVCITLKRGS